MVVVFSMRAWVDMSLMSLTFFLCIFWNIEVGVIVSLVISLLLVVHRSSKTRMTILVSFSANIHPFNFSSLEIWGDGCLWIAL